MGIIGTLVRGEGDADAGDPAVNEVYERLGTTYDFYQTVHQRNSLDDRGLRLDAVVHYGNDFNNAFWNGQRMIFGDGDGARFTGFTNSLDVIAHELTHGVTEFTAGLVYHKQPGALNESLSDVFGSLVKQWYLKQTAAQADWLIGAEIFTPLKPGDALRSLKAPGTAYNNSVFDKDPQSDHMDDYVDSEDTFFGDWGGVHINSGIPNYAFYRCALALGGRAWDTAGHIWYETLTKSTGPQAQFQDFADGTFEVAGRLHGAGSAAQQAVRDGWEAVGITTQARTAAGAERARPRRKALDGDTLAELHAKLDALAKRLDELAG